MAEVDLSQEQDTAGEQKEAGGVEWPRMIAPPLKRSGHVILEVCAASGEIHSLRTFPDPRWTDC